LSKILSNNGSFTSEILKNNEAKSEKITNSSEKNNLIEEIYNFLSFNASIPDVPMKVILWDALNEWQAENDINIKDIKEMSKGRRLNAVKEIFNIGRNTIKNMLRTPNKKNVIILDIAFEKAFKYYLDYINKNNY
jgi:hypothetical protein